MLSLCLRLALGFGMGNEKDVSPLRLLSHGVVRPRVDGADTCDEVPSVARDTSEGDGAILLMSE